MIDGTLCKYIDSDHAIEIREHGKHYRAKHFSVPKFHKPTLKKEVYKLIKIGVLKQINNSQSAIPTSSIPKIHGTVGFISDFSELGNLSNSYRSRFITKTKRF